MGRGNVCVTGPYEGLYYIDYDDVDVYRRNSHLEDYPETKFRRELSYEEICGNEWVYDEWGSAEEQDYVLECFISRFSERFPSFTRCEPNEWLRNGLYGDLTRRAILESKLFYITVEDNEWSLAVELIQKEDPYDNHLEGLQKRHFQTYLDGIRDTLFEQFETLSVRNVPWMSKQISRKEHVA